MTNPGEQFDVDTVLTKMRSSRPQKPQRSVLRRRLTDITLSYGVALGLFGMLTAMHMSGGATLIVALRHVLRWRFIAIGLLLGTTLYLHRRQEDDSARD